MLNLNIKTFYFNIFYIFISMSLAVSGCNSVGINIYLILLTLYLVVFK